jgi:tetratricopeptide (TPR) repeat protein
MIEAPRMGRVEPQNELGSRLARAPTSTSLKKQQARLDPSVTALAPSLLFCWRLRALSAPGTAMPKIAVYTMAKNEAENVARFVDTTRGADCVVVTDTGSTDGTPDLLRDAGVAVHSARILPWRFDTATNVALAHVPDDVEVCVKLDLDEVLFTTDGSPWREEIERLWQPGVHRVRYWYTWSWHAPPKEDPHPSPLPKGEGGRDPHLGLLPGDEGGRDSHAGSLAGGEGVGRPAVRFRTENIHGRSGFVWRHPGHAALCSTGREGRTAETQRLEIHHYMQSKQRPNYLSLLELAVQESRCPRTLFYLGREYYFRRIDQRAIETLEEYLAHPAARWPAERADALRMIGVGCQRQGDAARALCALLQAIAQCPEVRDLWFELLRHFHDAGDWLGGLWAGGKCLAIERRHAEFVGHGGSAWSEQPLVLAARCAWHSGRADEAVRLIRAAVAAWPHSETAKTLAREILQQHAK